MRNLPLTCWRTRADNDQIHCSTHQSQYWHRNHATTVQLRKNTHCRTSVLGNYAWTYARLTFRQQRAGKPRLKLGGAEAWTMCSDSESMMHSFTLDEPCHFERPLEAAPDKVHLRIGLALVLFLDLSWSWNVHSNTV